MTSPLAFRTDPSSSSLVEPSPGGPKFDGPESGVPALADQLDAGHRLDLSTFDADARGKIDQIVAKVPRLDGAAVNAFGIAPQANANKYLDMLLEGIRTADVGLAGSLVAELATGIKMLDIPGMRREAAGTPGLLARLPAVGKYLSAFQRFKARYEDISRHFTRIEEQGRKEMARLAAMDSKLDGLVATNLANMREIELHVAAGQVILDREKARFMVDREAALIDRDPGKLAAVRDHGDQINGFETRLMRLHMAAADALLSVPQTRLTQSAGRIEYRNIVDTLLFDLPRLKSAILRIAALKQIGDASRSSEARRKLAGRMAQAGIDALDLAYTRAKESESGALAEITAMGAIADRIIGIVDKGATLDARNRQTRDEAARLLSATKDKFVDGLARSTALAVASTRG